MSKRKNGMMNRLADNGGLSAGGLIEFSTGRFGISQTFQTFQTSQTFSKPAFTIIELLVASLLLGMLMTILTMIFNQSSIAWRTGMAGTVAMDAVRENIAEVREEADNAFGWGNTLYRITGVWGKDGQLRKRACDAPGSGSDESESHAELLRSLIGSQMASLRQKDIQLTPQWASGGGGGGGGGIGQIGGGGKKTYTVNVMSAGPDRQFDTWDDVWSWPDDFE